MVTIHDAKQAIFDTDCARYLREGTYRSEPVFQMVDDNLADVYFVYGRNREATKYVAPLVSFGIFYDIRRTAFVDESKPARSATCDEPGPQSDPQSTVSEYEEIEKLYPVVRDCAFKNCSNEQAESVRGYCLAIEKVSGPILWGIYKEVAPEFFAWAKLAIAGLDK